MIDHLTPHTDHEISSYTMKASIIYEHPPYFFTHEEWTLRSLRHGPPPCCLLYPHRMDYLLEKLKAEKEMTEPDELLG